MGILFYKKGAKKEKKKGGGAAAPKKAAVLDTKVIITRVQRQKKKFNTVVGGLETVPDVKIKDVCKAFGKKFSSGCSINESPQSNAKEVVIQGDVLFDLPAILMNDFKVRSSLSERPRLLSKLAISFHRAMGSCMYINSYLTLT